MSEWLVRTFEEARTAPDRPLAEWPALEHDGRCQAVEANGGGACAATASYVATSRTAHMRVLLCAEHAERVRV